MTIVRPPPSQASAMAPNDTGAEARAARTWKAAQDFESMAINEMLQPMFSSGQSEDGGFFGGGVGEKQFRPMLVNEIAKNVEHTGGLGLAQAIYKQMVAMQEKKS